MALLSTWVSLESSYLAQVCTYTGATYRGEIVHLLIIFLKLRIFKIFHILHFIPHLANMPNINIYKCHTIHRNTYIYRHMYTQIQIAYLHFALFGSYGIHAKNTNFIFGTSHKHGNRYRQAHAHAHADTQR